MWHLLQHFGRETKNVSLETVTIVFILFFLLRKGTYLALLAYYIATSSSSLCFKMNDQENPASVPLLGHCNNGTSVGSQKAVEQSHDVEKNVLSDYPKSPSVSMVVEEIKELCVIALPMIITGLLIYGKSAISMFYMGKLGKEALAGGSLAIGVANITGYSVISGLAMGMEPISSQACGAKQWSLMGQTLQRTITIITFSCIPISLFWLNFEPILIFCGQDPQISSIASTYLLYSIPDLLLQSLINPLKVYLRTQNLTLPLMFSAAFALTLHGPINYILFHYMNLGVQGIAFSVALADLNLVCTLFLYIYFSETCQKTWKKWSLECFSEWKPILGLAIPSCISVCLEWWWYELMIVLSGFLNNAPEAVATMGILIQATSLVYIFPSSLSLAVSTRVGNALGANQPGKSRLSSIIALSSAIFMSFIAVWFMISTRHSWGQIFTNDKAVLSLTAVAMPVVGLCELGNCPQTTGCGVLRGCARPTLGANINLGCFYGVGLPVAIFMGFGMGLGLFGICLGLLSAQAFCAVIMVVVLLRTDWRMQASRAKELTRGANGEDDQFRADSTTVTIVED